MNNYRIRIRKIKINNLYFTESRYQDNRDQERFGKFPNRSPFDCTSQLLTTK